MSNIYDVTFCENNSLILVVNYFHETFHHRCLGFGTATDVIINSKKYTVFASKSVNCRSFNLLVTLEVILYVNKSLGDFDSNILLRSVQIQ